tara:strand:+ start:691 stop:1020 length:330 start_codon:yes stop_codon:yes gene_type:complete
MKPVINKNSLVPKYNVFDTEEEAITAHAYDCQKYNEATGANVDCFDEIREREDGKWIVAATKYSDGVYTQEDYCITWKFRAKAPEDTSGSLVTPPDNPEIPEDPMPPLD